MPVDAANNPKDFGKYLPTLFGDDPVFRGLLRAFERIYLGGCHDSEQLGYKGLDEEIASLAALFSADASPHEFLPWLASWLSLHFRADLPDDNRRQLIWAIVDLYRWRGTPTNLARLLKIYTNAKGEVSVVPTAEKPHSFDVTMLWESLPHLELSRQINIARDVIAIEKPAHTKGILHPCFPTMQIGVRSTIGDDTRLGGERGRVEV